MPTNLPFSLLVISNVVCVILTTVALATVSKRKGVDQQQQRILEQCCSCVSVTPTLLPSLTASDIPSVEPTFPPSDAKRMSPSLSPTLIPSSTGGAVPSVEPTFPLIVESMSPSISRTLIPSSTDSEVPSVEPTTIETDIPTLSLSQPNNRGRVTINDFQYAGAFRLKPGVYGGEEGTFTANYAVGTLAYNPTRNSLFIAGHAQQTRIAEFPLDGVTPGMADDVNQLPVTNDPLQGFISPLDAPSINNEQGLDRITGLMVTEEGSLIVNAELWYDAGAQNTDTTLVVQDAGNLGGSISGIYEMTCQAEGAGYIGNIPTEWQGAFGGASYYTGWSSVYSINGRYSLGPSLFGFSGNAIGDVSVNPAIATTPFMNYSFRGGSGQWLSPRAVENTAQGTAPGPFPPADPVWNDLSTGVYGFFVPNSDTFAVIGSTAGLTSGIGYKAVQSDGYVCPGPCAYEPNDNYNYYWLYDINEILAASNVWDPRPYDYGIWNVPFGDNQERQIIGGTLDEEKSILYVAVRNAAQVGDYDRPPLIVTFQL